MSWVKTGWVSSGWVGEAIKERVRPSSGATDTLQSSSVSGESIEVSTVLETSEKIRESSTE